jgi:raffinose/stachyose/melibiose transport system substrate-binding protein
MIMKSTRLAISAAFIFSSFTVASAQQVELTIESWRNDDLLIWQQKILPAFHKSHPDIKVTFSPTVSTQYNASLNAKLDSSTAGDLITCRPFDLSLNMFKRGQLADLTALSGMENFTSLAKTAWSTDDGTQTFCVPMAAVLHGFIYNKDAFEELGLTPPNTQEEFFALLDKIKTDGNYVPLAIGTSDEWGTASMGYQNIGPTFWKGEAGRKALLDGSQKLTDAPWVEAFTALKRWGPYMGDGYQAQSYSDSQNMFTLGRAAIYPGGSWEIGPFKAQGAEFPMGAFPPPVDASGKCYVTDHPDIALGMNAKARNPEAAKTFLSWVASSEFAQLYATALPGFFPLAKSEVKVDDPLAQDFLKMRTECEPTIRPFYQVLSRGSQSAEELNKIVSASVINGSITPEEAAKRMQDAISWYKP